MNQKVTHHQVNNDILDSLQNRALWLSLYMVDYANNIRKNPSTLKVGGHPSSSTSVITTLTYLYFEYLNAGDRIAIKPHASPAYHAIQYLLGNLDPSFLKKFRELGGLQSYPSRTKDPDFVDYSSGSVGLGAVAPNFNWLADEYLKNHTKNPIPERRYFSLLGDAELDEGSIWEAIAEPNLIDSKNIIWIIDLNRQSLDRIIPGIRVRAWRQMFDANGWQVHEAKYGTKLQDAFHLPKGDLLKQSIDAMPNELYQRLLLLDGSIIREYLPLHASHPKDLKNFIKQWNDQELKTLFTNLGGHDFDTLRNTFSGINNSSPNVVFAYTFKGWKLPSIGDPQNHSIQLSQKQMRSIMKELSIDATNPIGKFDSKSTIAKLCKKRKKDLYQELRSSSTKDMTTKITIPDNIDRTYSGLMSSQQIFGLTLTELIRSLDNEITEKIVTVSPDVASSTNLGGWINKKHIWTSSDQVIQDLPEEKILRSLKWTTSKKGQHIELGISENNLFLCLGQLGLTKEMSGDYLIPIGTVYDPFIRRGLDALVYSLYSGSKFILIGTPSGVTLGPEGGAHQSIITPSIGTETPDLLYYEPCFGKELEWILLFAIKQVMERKNSIYLRLSTLQIDQTLFNSAYNELSESELREKIINGGYKLIDRSSLTQYNVGKNTVNIIATGAILPEAIKASHELLEEGVFANVINITGPGILYKKYQALTNSTNHSSSASNNFINQLISESISPIVTVMDGHPHTLSWIGSAIGAKVWPLGISSYGESGDPYDLYKKYKISSDDIMDTCYTAIESI